MEITKFKEGDKVYGACLSRNILPFYGEVVSVRNNYNDAYICVFTKKGKRSTKIINTSTNKDTVSCFDNKEECVDHWNNEILKKVQMLEQEIALTKTKIINKL